MSWYSRRPPAPPPVAPEAFVMSAKAPVFNPSDAEQIFFAEYRADAIAREIEQRDRSNPHPDEQKMVAEAMAYAWMLKGAGRWSARQVHDLEIRLMAR